MTDPPTLRPQYLRVRNWEEFQHYKDRDPKWIKFHTKTLGDYELVSLPIPARLLYTLLLLVAARTDNNIPHDYEWIGSETKLSRKHVAEGVVALMDAGFLLLADRKRSASDAIAKKRISASPEKRREEVEKKEPGARARENNNGKNGRVRLLIANGVIFDEVSLEAELRANKITGAQARRLRAELSKGKGGGSDDSTLGKLKDACHADHAAVVQLNAAAKGCSEADLVGTLEACQGTDVLVVDRLEVALSELKKRRAA